MRTGTNQNRNVPIVREHLHNVITPHWTSDVIGSWTVITILKRWQGISTVRCATYKKNAHFPVETVAFVGLLYASLLYTQVFAIRCAPKICNWVGEELTQRLYGICF